jgi:anti-sigma factor RsiW
MMKDDLHCIELVARLGEYLEGAMPPDERRRFEVHMEACSGCHRFFLQLGLVRTALRDAPMASESDDYSPRLSALFSDWKRTRETRP